jgi:putative salt-induced outer membrane protein YdiY
VLTLALPLLLLAGQPDTVVAARRAPAEIKFTGDIGYVATAGNSSVETLNLGDKFSAKIDDVTLSQTFALVYGESDGEAVTSLYRASLRIDKGLKTRGLFAYGLLNFERNVFAGLSSRMSGALGLSAHLFNNDNDKLVVETGVSLTRQRATETKGRDLDFLGGRAATTYTHLFGRRSSISQAVELLPNFRETEDLRINTETALVAPLTGAISIKLSYVIRYDGLPAEGFRSTDRLFTSGIQVSL